MLNVRTWYWLSLSGCILFPAVIAGWMLPPNSVWGWPVLIAIGWGILVAVFGALQGIMLAFGKLHMGCPRCRARSHVTGGDRNGMFLDCPGCGFLRVETGGDRKSRLFS